MTSVVYYSGITFLLICTNMGFTHGLNCITCTWDAYMPDSVNSSELCLSDAHMEMNKTCPKVDNLDSICETKIEYHVIGKLKTIKKIERRCEYDNPDCNKPCIPDKNNLVCYQCCNRFSNCNTLPLTLDAKKPTSDASTMSIKGLLYYVTLVLFLVCSNAFHAFG